MTESVANYEATSRFELSTLGDYRRLFTANIIKVLAKMIEDGFEPMIERDGNKHMPSSLHYDGLAMDIILTNNRTVITDTESHLPFGIFWKGLHPNNAWGGDFAKTDGNHYSIGYQGRR